MKVWGLTGGIGMGKSTVARSLALHGARVLDVDDLARDLVQTGQPALAEIRAAFGDSVFAPDGQLNRSRLAEQVFTDPVARRQLEQILHPRIRAAWLSQVAQWRQSDHAFAVVVIPLLFETACESHFDRILCVACLPLTQQQRLAERGWSPIAVQQRIAAQLPVEAKMNRSHYVLWSEGRMASLEQQISRLLARS